MVRDPRRRGRVTVYRSKTNRFRDLTVTDKEGKSRKLLLKSTVAMGLSKRTVHISTLTEAAWIQDVRSVKAGVKTYQRGGAKLYH